MLAANMLAIVDGGVSAVAEPPTSSLTSRDTVFSKEERCHYDEFFRVGRCARVWVPLNLIAIRQQLIKRRLFQFNMVSKFTWLLECRTCQMGCPQGGAVSSLRGVAGVDVLVLKHLVVE